MNSCLYVGQVKHKRYAPKVHAFQYKLFMVYLDLDELDGLFDRFWLWSSNRFNIAYFKRSDHIKGCANLKQAVLETVERETGIRPDGRVCLLTHLRYFGIGFNPVSFYYCFSKQTKALHTIVVEVNNTPWGEQYIYVLPASELSGFQVGSLEFVRQKAFHVSPFMPMDIKYTWRFTEPSDALGVEICNQRDGSLLFDARLNLQKQDLSHSNLRKALVNFPLVTLKVFGAIYFEALRLALKRISFYPYPSNQ